MIFNYFFQKIKDRTDAAGGSDGGADKTVGAVLTSAADNERLLKELFAGSSDFVTRGFTFKGVNGESERAVLAFMDGMTSAEILNDSIIKPLMYGVRDTPDTGSGACGGEPGNRSSIEAVNDILLSVGEIKVTSDISDAVEGILNGDCVMFIDGCGECTVMNCKGFEKRGVEQPAYDVSMRGPRESFNENLRTNTSLLRRRIKNRDLVFESTTVGRKTNTNVCIVYVNGLADAELVAEVKRRISYINVDLILESGYIEEYIEDSPFSVFATMGITERPDVLAGKLLEGRVGIMVDGSPFVLTAPYLFAEAFQNPEDYYSRTIYSSLVRIFRYIAFLLSILVPGLYVALTSFHQELIPSSLLFNMAAASEGVPFTSFAEIAIFLFVFEMLKEAGVHMPKNIGQTTSIVGGLVLGDAAVQAGIISAPAVIIISFTAVSSFMVPAINNEITLLRWIFLFLGGVLGGYGISVGIIGLTLHITGMQSFGYSFFAPFFPERVEDIKDTFVRVPLWMMRRRPTGMAHADRVRENTPIPPNDK